MITLFKRPDPLPPPINIAMDKIEKHQARLSLDYSKYNGLPWTARVNITRHDGVWMSFEGSGFTSVDAICSAVLKLMKEKL